MRAAVHHDYACSVRRSRLSVGLVLLACCVPRDGGPSVPVDPPVPSSVPTSSPATPMPPTIAPSAEPIAVTSVEPVAPPPAPAGPCPEDMVDVGVACIDRFEAPNEKGQKPPLMQSALDGEAWCAERGKRLCRESEWNRACMGERGFDFPYGAKWERGVCNDDKTWKPPRWGAIRSHPSEASRKEAARLDQSEPAGSREGCASPDGAFDLTGNAAEWVVRTEDNDTNYDHVVKGCYWARCYRPPHTPSCDYVNWMHQGAERSYEMGFRCCKDRE